MNLRNATTRLAPSPTGALHLGNIRTFLVNYLLARQEGWRVLMRIEDLDGPRVKAGSATQLLEELAWLGLSWEEPLVYQSQRAELYRQALDGLITAGHAYPCVCSRKDVELAASAPHGPTGEVVYPGTCCGRFASHEDAVRTSGRPVAWRLKVQSGEIAFDDGFAGKCGYDLSKTCGDFVISKSDGTAAYQLAVVVDDAAAGVSTIVRGQDLLESTSRQIHLRRLLGLSNSVKYWHLPLVVGPDGRRLAKRHGDTRLEHYRALGATPQRILGLMGYWCGLLPNRRECRFDELLNLFDMSRLPKEQVVFAAEDDAFLSD